MKPYFSCNHSAGIVRYEARSIYSKQEPIPTAVVLLSRMVPSMERQPEGGKSVCLCEQSCASGLICVAFQSHIF